MMDADKYCGTCGEDGCDCPLELLQAENAALKADNERFSTRFAELHMEKDALKEQVAQLEDDLAALRLFQTNVEATHKETLRELQTVLMQEGRQLTTLQSKSAALKDAMEKLTQFNSSAEYVEVRTEHVTNGRAALAAFKGEK